MADEKDESNVRVELSAENSRKVREIAFGANISNTEVVNRLMSAVKDVELKQVITFAVEMRSEDDKTSPGRPGYLRVRNNFAKNW